MAAERNCPKCGTELFRNAPKGLCPQCLMKAGMHVGSEDANGDLSAMADTPTGNTPPGGFVPPALEELAATFPHLEIIELLGQGGMGAVYKARQRQLDRLVALKVLPPEVGQSEAFAERFTREARSLARLNHAHIITVHDFGRTPEGLYYFLMEYVDGTDLRHVIQAGELTPDQALAIIPQVCEALYYAHQKGIVHRDIKPENILLDRQGHVKIADFGLARLLDRPAAVYTLTQAGQRMGTPHYMAPEQIEHPHHVDHRADIYSLGVVFYEMLTGELPIGRFALPSRKVHIDVRLDEIVLHALEKEPQLRYQQASEVKMDVEAVREPRAMAGGRRLETSGLDDGRVRRALTVMGAVTVASGILTFLLLLGVFVDTSQFDIFFRQDAVLMPLQGLQILTIPVGILMVIGGVMPGTHGRGWSRLGAGLGLVPLTPAWLITLPLGIWILTMLNRPEVPVAGLPGTRSTLGNLRGSEGPSRQGRFSRMAIVGACLAPLALLAVLPPVFNALVYVFRFYQGPGDEISAGRVMLVLLGLIGFTTPFVTTILGVVAIATIRRSDGRMYGLGLALFDGLLFPLLALDTALLFVLALLGALIQIPKMVPLSLMGFAATLVLPVSVVVDVLVVRWIWRKLNRDVRGRAATPHPVPRLAEPLSPCFSRKAIVGAACIPLFVFLLIMLSTHEGYKRFETVFAPTGQQWGQWFFTLIVTVAGVAAPCVTTVLGSMALIEIRRSQGRIMGLTLALADVLLLPLFALDFGLVVLFCANQSPFQRYSAVTFPLALLIGVVLDVLIVRWAWRKATARGEPSLGGREPGPQTINN